MAPLIGFEIEPQPLSNAWIQPRLGTRIGWQFAPQDHWGTRPCLSDTSALASQDRVCTQWTIEPYLALTVYERLRIQFVERILPASRGLGTRWDSFIQFGFELTP
jgi:hypothetical protein